MTIDSFFSEYGMLIMSAVVVIIFGVMLTKIFKEADRKNTTIGKIVTEHFLKQFDTWILLTMGLLWITESLIAASIHPIGPDGLPEDQINSVARFMSHFGTALVGIIMVVFFPKVLLEFFESFTPLWNGPKKELPMKIFYVFTNLLLVCAVGYAVIRIPFFNIELIAGGLDDLDNVNFAWWEMTGRTINYPKLGLPKDYNPFKEMKFQMLASFLLLISHYLLSFIDSIIVLKKLVAQKINFGASSSVFDESRNYTPTDNDIEEVKRDPLKAIKFLVQKVTRNISGEELSELVDKLKDIYNSLLHVTENERDRTRAAIAARLAALVKKWEVYNNTSGGMTEEVKKMKKNTLKNETRDLFARRVNGFNYQLPSGN